MPDMDMSKMLMRGILRGKMPNMNQITQGHMGGTGNWMEQIQGRWGKMSGMSQQRDGRQNTPGQVLRQSLNRALNRSMR